MNHYPIKSNFRYPDLKPQDFRFGGNIKIIRENGDWRDYIPNPEDQLKYGIESSACFIEAQQHTIASIQEEEFGIPDQNYSSRFNMTFTDADEYGGSPISAAQSFRHDGIIPDSMLPFSEEITSWQDFNSFKGGNKNACIAAGKQFLKRWNLYWYIVFERFESKEAKLTKLRLALKESPVPMSVPGWYERDGIYFRPDGVRDNHLVECVHVDQEGYMYVFDTYEPYLKKLDKDINPEFAMKWTINKIKTETVELGVLAKLFALLKSLGIKLNA